MERIDLNGAWQGSGRDPAGGAVLTFPGTVPGCVHTDLRSAGRVPDYFWRDQADQVQWIEDWDWTYVRTFRLEALPEEPELVFEGLDTYAEIRLNGRVIGTCDNMFIDHRFSVDGALRVGENTLEVAFESPVRRVAGRPALPAAFTSGRQYTRRIQCTYGWDWVARFVTCGIYRPVYLESAAAARVESMYVYTEWADAEAAQLVIRADVRHPERAGRCRITLRDPDGAVVYDGCRYCAEPELVHRITVRAPRRWYPIGYGAQPLYTLTLEIGAEIRSERIGIRTVKVVQLPDEPGSVYEDRCKALQQTPSAQNRDLNESFAGFQLRINDVPIFCCGGNWVPCEPFPSAETAKKITQLLELAAGAGVNMIRVWGGGIFEQSHFYEECDRLGILVTQDFLMACATYPEDDPSFLEQLRREAAYAARRLRNRASLVWWSGDNENAVMGADDEPSFPGRSAALRAIQPVLMQLDPMRTFLPSSPYGGRKYCSKTYGTTHNTFFLGDMLAYMERRSVSDYRAWYRQFDARFIAEEPAMGAVCDASLARMMTEADRDELGDMWRYHTKNNPVMKRHMLDIVRDFASDILGEPANAEEARFKLRYIHYEWIRLAMEQARRNIGFCNGIVFWMLNDCWPAAAGWALLDYYTMPKASYYAFKRLAAPTVLSVDETQPGVGTLTAANRGSDDDTLHIVCTEWDLTDGRISTVGEWDCTVPAYDRVQRTLPLRDDRVLICTAFRSGRKADRTFWKRGAMRLCPSDAVRVDAEDRESITLTASAYVHAVELEGAFVLSDNYFSMLPGETVRLDKRPLSTIPPVKCDAGTAVRAYTLTMPD